MKKDIVITFFIALALVIGVSALNIQNNKAEENYFFVDTPLEKYSSLMSSYKGFPFIIKCNNHQEVTVEFTSGILQDENGILNKNQISCGTTIYWNDNEDVDSVNITFKSNDKSFEKEMFTLLKNEQEEYYLSK